MKNIQVTKNRREEIHWALAVVLTITLVIVLSVLLTPTSTKQVTYHPLEYLPQHYVVTQGISNVVSKTNGVGVGVPQHESDFLSYQANAPKDTTQHKLVINAGDLTMVDYYVLQGGWLVHAQSEPITSPIAYVWKLPIGHYVATYGEIHDSTLTLNREFSARGWWYLIAVGLPWLYLATYYWTVRPFINIFMQVPN